MAYNYTGDLTVSNTTTTNNLVVKNGMSDIYLNWSANYANNASPLDIAINNCLGANRLAFGRAAGVTIEYSNDSGFTWNDYGASDGEKINLLTYMNRSSFLLGKKTGSSYATNSDQLRITLNGVNMGVYTDMKKIHIYFSTDGASCKVRIEYQLFTSDTWNTKGTYTIAGESGWNVYTFSGTNFGGFVNESRAYIKNLRFTFYNTAASSRGTARVYSIMMYGPNRWNVYSDTPIASVTGQLYDSDYVQHMKVPNGIYPNTTLVGDFGSSSNIWKTGYIQTLNVTDKCNATNGFFQTSDIRKKDVKEELDLNRCYEMLDKCQEVLYTLKNDDKEQIGMIAQEVEEFFPEIISTDKDGYKSIDYSKLTVVCLRIIKDLYKRIEKLENKQ